MEIILEEYSSYEEQISAIKLKQKIRGNKEKIFALNYFRMILITIKENDKLCDVEEKLLNIKDIKETINSLQLFIIAESYKYNKLSQKAEKFLDKKNTNYYNKNIKNSPLSNIPNQEYLKKNIIEILMPDLKKTDLTLVELYFLRTTLEYLFFLKTNSSLRDYYKLNSN